MADPTDDDFYGIEPDTIPAFVGIGGERIPADEVAESTRTRMAALMEHMRNLYCDDPLAFEIVVTHIAARIDAANREGGEE
jgi:hypothetical protein